MSVEAAPDLSSRASVEAPQWLHILKIELPEGGGRLDDQAEDLREAVAHLRARAPTPLAVIDVDEVLGLFVQGFDRWLRGRGHELRMTSFRLFGNIFAVGGEEPAGRDDAKALFDLYFAQGCGRMEPAPGAVEALARIAGRAAVVILTNAPEASRVLRGDWMARHGLPYPLIVNAGPKGPPVRALAEAAGGRAAFVDDLLPNHDSVAEHAPGVARFQLIADPALRALAPAAEAHRRADDWGALEPLLEHALFLSPARG